MKKHHHFQLRQNAFTLIELLIVVAIIGILASLLLPALKNARMTANTISCRSNLKSIGQWAQMYVNDNKGILPGFNDGAKNAGNFYYCQNFYTIMKDQHLVGSKTLSENRGLRCAELTNANSDRFNLNKSTYFVSYSLNNRLGGSMKVYDSYASGVTIPPPTEKLLSGDKFWFVDGRLTGPWINSGTRYDVGATVSMSSTANFGSSMTYYPWPYLQPTTRAPDGDMANRTNGHNGRFLCNYVYGDGHAGGVSYRDYILMPKEKKKAFVGIDKKNGITK